VIGTSGLGDGTESVEILQHFKSGELMSDIWSFCGELSIGTWDLLHERGKEDAVRLEAAGAIGTEDGESRMNGTVDFQKPFPLKLCY